MNVFINHETGKLDKGYLRICAVYKLLIEHKKISKYRAIELIEQRNRINAKQLVEIWLRKPITKFDFQ